jgi:hypothetical protein
VLAVRELSDGKGSVRTSIVLLETTSGAVLVVKEGADFYTHPRFSPNGKVVSWMEWNFPEMPWTGAVLHFASWTVDGLGTVNTVEGHTGLSQPRWGLDGSLFFASDVSGWSQLYRILPDSSCPTWVHLKGLEEVEFGNAEFKLGR